MAIGYPQQIPSAAPTLQSDQSVVQQAPCTSLNYNVTLVALGGESRSVQLEGCSTINDLLVATEVAFQRPIAALILENGKFIPRFDRSEHHRSMVEVVLNSGDVVSVKFRRTREEPAWWSRPEHLLVNSLLDSTEGVAQGWDSVEDDLEYGPCSLDIQGFAGILGDQDRAAFHSDIGREKKLQGRMRNSRNVQQHGQRDGLCSEMIRRETSTGASSKNDIGRAGKVKSQRPRMCVCDRAKPVTGRAKQRQKFNKRFPEFMTSLQCEVVQQTVRATSDTRVKTWVGMLEELGQHRLVNTFATLDGPQDTSP